MSEVRRQTGILADRYLDVLLGDLRTVFLLLVQAPLIGILIAGVWDNLHDDTPTLYFVLALSAFFLGSVNSAREIVKEREIFLRERMAGLRIAAYVHSKYRVLAMIAVLQCACLAGIVGYTIPLRVNPLFVFMVIVAVAAAGTAVGLWVSAMSKTSDKAVMMVPLVVIPQILLSELVLSGQGLQNWTRFARWLMPVHWGYEILEQFRNQTEWDAVFGASVVLALTIAIAYGATRLALSNARP